MLQEISSVPTMVPRWMIDVGLSGVIVGSGVWVANSIISLVKKLKDKQPKDGDEGFPCKDDRDHYAVAIDIRACVLRNEQSLCRLADAAARHTEILARISEAISSQSRILDFLGRR